MPKELRRIVFSHLESTEAIVHYGKKFNMTFPGGKIIKAAFAGQSEYDFHSMKSQISPYHKQHNIEEKARAVIVTFFDDTTFEHKYFNLTADFISAAMIEFCLDNKILLPSTALKTLDVTEFNIVLDINLENLHANDVALHLED